MEITTRLKNFIPMSFFKESDDLRRGMDIRGNNIKTCYMKQTIIDEFKRKTKKVQG